VGSFGSGGRPGNVELRPCRRPGGVAGDRAPGWAAVLQGL